MQYKREFFPVVRRTVVPRPVVKEETDVLGQSGSVRASQAVVFGPNWYHNKDEDLIEIWDAGAALSFRDVLPKKDKYRREGLYLRLSLAYRTSENACSNIRTFSGNHVTLPNSVTGAMFDDPHTIHWVTDDLCLNVNSIYQGERLWLQRVDWEWASRQTIFEDELESASPMLVRTRKEVEALYRLPFIDEDAVRDYLAQRVRNDAHFAKRCMAMLQADALMSEDFVSLFKKLPRQED